MTQPAAVVFAMPEQGHFKRMLPLVEGLARSGVPTHVFTDLRFRASVERTGAHFVDLFAGRPIDSADARSLPVPCRFVSFAGHYADAVREEVAALRPALVVHDGFAVIGPVVAHALGIPRVNVCAGHNLAPGPTVAALRVDPRVRIAEECWEAVRLLQERHGLSDASPFSYASTHSPHLNVYCEPPEFLRPEEREPFQPITFFGSLAPEASERDSRRGSVFGDDAARRLRVYVSFGTVIWRYYEAEAMRALEAFADALAARDDATALVSLGGRSTPERVARIARPNVRVEDYVDQWAVLREASLFLTHQGLNSTHEAIYHETPMLSYPFFSDQPGLARRCRELGLAVPLAETLRGEVTPEAVGAALDRTAAEGEALRARLSEAREWELATIRARPAALRRIVGLAGRG